MSDFDPFDPSTWKQKSGLDDPEVREHLIAKLNEINQAFSVWSRDHQLCLYLEGKEVSKNFQDALEQDAELNEIVEWLTASDARREKAAKILRAHLSLVRCPNCDAAVDRDDFRDMPAFDWALFANKIEE